MKGKKITKVTVAIGGVLFFMANGIVNVFADKVLGPNLFINGDAEMGDLTGWEVGGGKVSIVSADPNEGLGKYSFHLVDDSDTTKTTLQKEPGGWILPIEGGKKYRLQFSVYDVVSTPGTDGWASPWVDVIFGYELGSKGWVTPERQIGSITALTHYTYDFQAFKEASAIAVIFSVVKPDSGTGEMKIDNISLREVISEPEDSQLLRAEELLAWLKSREDRTLVISPSFLFLPVLASGKPIYESREERNMYYSSLGIWKNTELKEYWIKEISWTDSKFLLPKPGPVKLKALLPAQNIAANLPEGSRILLKGRTEEGREVPLIFEINMGKNRIINIAFSLSPNLDIEKSVTMSVLNHIKTTSGITPDIICNAETGYGLWENHLWESHETIDDTMSITRRLNTGAISKGKGTLPSILFWCSFLRNNKPTFVGISLIDEPIHTVSFILSGKQFNVDIIKPGATGMVSIDSSIMGATYYYEVEGIIFASTDEVTQWLIETLDGEDYARTNLFRLYTESGTKVFLLRPILWVEEELIHALKIEDDRLEPVPITVDRNTLVLKSTGGDYLVYYGSIKERELSKFWDKFILSLKDKKEIDIGDKINYNQYEGDFNVHWVEL